MSQEVDQQLRRAIQSTVGWFALFDHPLTLAELRRFLGYPVSLAELTTQLATGVPGISEKQGLYSVAERPEMVNERQKRYNYSDRKFKRSAKLIKCFAWLPWLRFVAMANLMGAHNLRDQGDIDLLIITKARRLWLTRLLLAGSLKLLDLRPRAGKARDTFCLSFLLSDDALELADLRLADQDPYFLFWLASICPLYDRGDHYAELLAANPWLTRSLPNWQQPTIGSRRLQNDKRPQSAGWPLWDRLEKLAAAWQLKHLPPEIKILLNQDSRVVANERIIKLHANDRRRQFLDNFQNWQKNNFPL